MECKKCGKDLTDMEYKKVAEWPFCLECFQALMDKAGEKKEEKPEGETDMPVHQTAPAGIRQRCQICEKEIEEGNGRNMLGLLFCMACYENLVKRPAIPPRAESGEEESEVKPLVAQVRVDLRRPVPCHACGRQIPAMGSKAFKGHPYCPDCYNGLPEIKAQKPKPFPAGAEKERYAPEEMKAGLKCQACSRDVLPENLKTVEGFEICLACLSTDPDTAFKIARARHRRALEEIKKEFDA
jgi:formylmethanofuran dehydrogenase subunit E